MPDDPAPPEIVRRILDLAAEDHTLRDSLVEYAPGDLLLREGTHNDLLFILLRGRAELVKSAGEPDGPVRVSEHGTGDILGVNSYTSGGVSFCTARAVTPLHCLKLDAGAMTRLPASHPSLHSLIQRLVSANLADRYRAAVQLQVDLLRANRELRETRDRLIHQEKMAVLGQLVAGVAHELNNPAAAILRQRDYLDQTLRRLCQLLLDDSPDAPWHRYHQAGVEAVPLNGTAARAAIDDILTHSPNLPRALARRLSLLPTRLRPRLLEGADTSGLRPEAETLLAVFETAHFIHVLDLSASQISHLVDGLRNYARPGSSVPETVPLRDSIENVLTLLGYLLKERPVETTWHDGLSVRARPGDLNQIWTNLIKNACEAMGPSGTLHIRTEARDDEARVAIIDHGPGIPPEMHAKIFDVNYTTKTGDENFGLGLGLSITHGLISQMGGRLELTNTPGSGCTFTVILPRS